MATTSARIGNYVPPEDVYDDEPILLACMGRDDDGWWEMMMADLESPWYIHNCAQEDNPEMFEEVSQLEFLAGAADAEAWMRMTKHEDARPIPQN